MKKMLFIFLCAVMLLSLCSCTQASSAPLSWSEETQEMIKRDYAKLRNYDSTSKTSADAVFIGRYYGIYQDCAAALYISANEAFCDWIVEEDIADCHFTFGSGQPLYIYHKGQFTPIGEAYENGIISKEDVAEIHKLHSLRMDKELYDRIRQDYAKNSSEYSKAEEVVIEDFYGVYQDNAAAIYLFESNYPMNNEEDIADVHFKFTDSRPIYIYKEGVFTPLKKAYEEGIISKEDVSSIHVQYEMSEYYKRCFGE